jgi:hypothetical protein
VKDPELTSLLMKRRKEIGKFELLESNDNYGSFARIFGTEALSDTERDPGNLSQYHFNVLDVDTVEIDLYMEYESGIFYPLRRPRSQVNGISTFDRLVKSLKKRDQECGHTLKCRTTLLQAFDATTLSLAFASELESYITSVEKLIGYASKTSIQLRFFQEGAGEANRILHNLTRESLLSHHNGPKIAELPISPSTKVIGTLEDGNWFVAVYDKYTYSILHLSNKDRVVASTENGSFATCRELSFFTFGKADVSLRPVCQHCF